MRLRDGLNHSKLMPKIIIVQNFEEDAPLSSRVEHNNGNHHADIYFTDNNLVIP